VYSGDIVEQVTLVLYLSVHDILGLAVNFHTYYCIPRNV